MYFPRDSSNVALEDRTSVDIGVATIDRHLGGGLPSLGLHEIDAVSCRGTGLLFTAFLAARTGRGVVWVRAHADLFTPALAQAGLPPDRLTYVETWRQRHVLAAAEEALRTGSHLCVVAEAIDASLTATRRLHMAAKASGSLALLVRHGPLTEGSAALTRWRAAPLPAAEGNLRRLPRARWRLDLVRARSCPPASWDVLAPDPASGMVLCHERAELRGRTSDGLADGPSETARRTAA